MRKILVCIFFILTFLCSCSKMNEEAVVWFNKANALWDDEKYSDPKKAIEYLNNAIKLQPDYASAYYNRASAYFNQGNNKLGCRDAQKLCSLGDCKVLERAKGKRLCR